MVSSRSGFPFRKFSVRAESKKANGRARARLNGGGDALGRMARS